MAKRLLARTRREKYREQQPTRLIGPYGSLWVRDASVAGATRTEASPLIGQNGLYPGL